MTNWQILPIGIIICLAAGNSPARPGPALVPSASWFQPYEGFLKTETLDVGEIIPTSIEVQVFDAINLARTNPAAYGYPQLTPVPPLHWNAALLSIGRVHSADMIADNYFAHDSYDDVGGELVFVCYWYERIRTVYAAPRLAENIAGNYGSPASTVQMWMDSTGHRNNIMNSALTEGAIGVVVGGPYGRMWTHDFGGGRTVAYNLAVSAADIAFDPPVPAEGDTVRITVTVRNTGATDAYPVEVSVYRGDPAAGGVIIGAPLAAAPICQAGKSVSVETTLDTAGLPPSVSIFAVADSADRFAETRESDNKASKTLNLFVPLPGDLTADGAVDYRDLMVLASTWMSGDPKADLDGSGSVDPDDLLSLLNLWHTSAPAP